MTTTYVDGLPSSGSEAVQAIDSAWGDAHQKAVQWAWERMAMFLEQPDNPYALQQLEGAIRGVQFSWWTMKQRG